MPYNHWSECDELLLIQMFDSGATLKKIAGRLGRSEGAINQRTCKLKLSREKPKRRSNLFTDNMDEILLQMYLAGASSRKIAKALGCTTGQAYYRLGCLRDKSSSGVSSPRCDDGDGRGAAAPPPTTEYGMYDVRFYEDGAGKRL